MGPGVREALDDDDPEVVDPHPRTRVPRLEAERTGRRRPERDGHGGHHRVPHVEVGNVAHHLQREAPPAPDLDLRRPRERHAHLGVERPAHVGVEVGVGLRVAVVPLHIHAPEVDPAAVVQRVSGRSARDSGVQPACAARAAGAASATVRKSVEVGRRVACMGRSSQCGSGRDIQRATWGGQEPPS